MVAKGNWFGWVGYDGLDDGADANDVADGQNEEGTAPPTSEGESNKGGGVFVLPHDQCSKFVTQKDVVLVAEPLLFKWVWVLVVSTKRTLAPFPRDHANPTKVTIATKIRIHEPLVILLNQSRWA
jgi:hypothetical protein